MIKVQRLMTDDKSKSDCQSRTYKQRQLSTEGVRVQDTVTTYMPHSSKEDSQSLSIKRNILSIELEYNIQIDQHSHVPLCS